MVKNRPANTGHIEIWVWSLSWEDPLEEEMATHYRILAWRIPWTEEPGGLAVHKSPRVRQDWRDLARMCGGRLGARVRQDWRDLARICGGRLGETVRKGATFLFALSSKSLQWDLLQHQASFSSSWAGLTGPFQSLYGTSIFRVWPAALLPVTQAYSFRSPSLNLVASLDIYCLWNSLSVSLCSRTALNLEDLIPCARQPSLKGIVCFLLSWPDLDW